MAAHANSTSSHFGLALACSASGLAVVGAGWAAGAFGLGYAAAGAALALGVGFLASAPWRRDAAELAERARSIGDEDAEPQPAARRTGMGGDIARALIESQRRVRREHRALEERAATSESVLDAAPEPLIVIDAGQTITHANRAAEVAFGDQMIGRALVDVIRSPQLLDAAEAVLLGQEFEAAVDLEVGRPGGASYRAIVGRLEWIGGAGEAAVIALQDFSTIRRLEQMRADFVANASHELRTPLTSLVGFIETLQGPAESDPAARKRFLGIMRDQANRMSRLVEDLLSLSKIEMEEHSPAGVTDDIETVVRSVVDQLAPVANDRGAEIRVHSEDQLPPVNGDEDLLGQVFRNLIENALKYGPDGGTVDISIHVRGESVRISVADQGDGVPSEHVPRLTERFYRVDVARSRDMGGTGLGLAIVKHILNRCDGSLSINSIKGRGSTFTVTLPFGVREAAANDVT